MKTLTKNKYNGPDSKANKAKFSKEAHTANSVV